MSTMTVSPLAVSPLAVRPLGVQPATVRAEVGAAARPPVRLTRRGRLLVTVLAVLVAVTGAVLLTGGASALAGTGGSGSSVAPAERVTVRPGETLWQIAERAAPGADPRETVQRILDLNGLQTSQVQAGTALRLP